jgi:glucose/arabinose dehydrogenase
LAATAPGAQAHGGPLPSGFRDSVAIADLGEPTTFRIAPDGRIFVAQKNGRIFVYDDFEDTDPELFADLRKQVYDQADRGLLGLALDPRFEQPQHDYVYALYTFDHVLGEDPPGAFPRWGQPPNYEGDPCPKPESADVDACPVSGRLVRMEDEGGAAGPEQVLVEDWCQQFSSHSIGDLNFGPEGALFASGGEGASFGEADSGQFGWPHANQCGDPLEEGGSLRSQDLLTAADPTGLSGSVIRIDPETGAAWPGNPLAAGSDANAARIVAHGFRNPFRFAIDPQRREAFVGNVGSDFFEEIDRFPLAPATPYNSGWPCFEGPDPTPQFESLGLGLCEGLYAQPGSTGQPLFYFEHYNPVTPHDHCPSEDGSAIAGMAVYRGDAFPAIYDGALFFADAVRGCIYVMLADASGELDPLTVQPFLSDAGPYSGADVQIGPDGDLYYLSLYADEGLHRISYDPGAPTASLLTDREWGPKPLTVHLDAGASADPDGEALSYAWDLDGNGSFEDKGGGPLRTLTFDDVQNHAIGVEVRDATGKTDVAELTVYPGDAPPRIVIEEPLEALTWRVGQEIDFYGKAWREGGAGLQLPASRLFWSTTLAHCPGGPDACHEHPLRMFPGVEAGTVVAPTHDYPSYIELTLTATDARGLAATKTVRVQPRAVTLDLRSEPPGIALTAADLNRPSPFQLTVVEGTKVGLTAPPEAQIGGDSYVFQGWSDGGTRVHSVLADAAATYTAVYSSPSRPQPEAGTESEEKPPPAAVGAGPTLTAHPRARTAASGARFAFAGPEPGLTYVCKLDAKPYAACRSPRSYRRLRPGWHVFRVAVAGPAGALASAPSVFRWRVLGDSAEPRRESRVSRG